MAVRKSEILTCFISFCEQDGNSEEITVLINELQERISDKKLGRVDFHFSGHIVNQSIKDHESLVNNCDVFMPLFTREYKRRVDERERGTGVYREFMAYQTRKEKQSVHSAEIFVIPVVWRGEYGTSAPKIMELQQNAAPLGDFHTIVDKWVSQHLTFEV